MTIRYFVSAGALVGLTACGGSGASNLGKVDLSDFPNASYGDLDLATDRLVSYRRTEEATDFSGTATYYGVILMAEDLDARFIDKDNASGVTDQSGNELSSGVSSTGVVGQVRLRADFTAATEAGYTVDGTATNFYLTELNDAGNPDGLLDDLSGSLSLVLSATSLDGNYFALLADGQVEVDGVLVDVVGTFNDNLADPENANQIAGFKSPDGTTPTALWVRTADESGLTVDGVVNTWDGVIAAD